LNLNRLRTKLILIFVVATLAPLAATIWITTSLLERSLSYSYVTELEGLSRSLETTGREFYQRERDELKRTAPERTPARYTAADRATWPDAVQRFADSGDPERFALSGEQGERLDYLVRHGNEVWVYSAGLGGVAFDRLSRQIRESRDLVDAAHSRDLQRGFKLTYIFLAAALWLTALALLVYLAHRTSRPIQQLNAGLSRLAAGDLGARVPRGGDDEVGRAIDAFNRMAGRLQESTERLVYLRQMASWQALARKMAHEVKNSLTPIRLTVEEMFARHESAGRDFMEQATQIVVDEIETLERRVRAFSQFAAEPPVEPAALDINAVLQERIALLKAAHPEVAYETELDRVPGVIADQDLLKGILTNLLENAAEAAGEGGRILGRTVARDGQVAVEIHDSGPGLSEQARACLFEPTISFKKRGMGLGLSIARKSALLSGGDIVVVKGELGGAGFRVLLPAAAHASQARAGS
jgi:nitrogen fixation/metabolism regulation signal transduction histidine kinase